MCVRIDELLAGQASLVEIDLPKAAAVEADRIVAPLQLHKAAQSGPGKKAVELRWTKMPENAIPIYPLSDTNSSPKRKQFYQTRDAFP